MRSSTRQPQEESASDALDGGFPSMLLKFIFDTFILLHSLHDRPRSVRSYPRFPAFFSGVRLACGVRRVGSGASPPVPVPRAGYRSPRAGART